MENQVVKQGKFTMYSQSRIAWLDGVRCLAILCVILCHAVEYIYSATALSANGLVNSSWHSVVFAFLTHDVYSGTHVKTKIDKILNESSGSLCRI